MRQADKLECVMRALLELRFGFGCAKHTLDGQLHTARCTLSKQGIHGYQDVISKAAINMPPDSTPPQRNSSSTSTMACTSATPFQNAPGLRSSSGGRCLFKNA